jgi:predicted nucleotidyltransferase
MRRMTPTPPATPPPADLDQQADAQITGVVGLVRSTLADDAQGAYLYGSAVMGGLRPRSDLDVFVVSRRPMSRDEKRGLIDGLMAISGRRATAGPARSLEVTVVVQSDVRPWRYPPRLDFQYGDWFRSDYESGNDAPWSTPNPDLAVLLTTMQLANRSLFGPPASSLLEPVPRGDLDRAMVDGIPGLLAEVDDDTANVMLTLARIWATLATGEIHPKDEAADWALARLPEERRAVLARSRAVYLGEAPDAWNDLRPHVMADAEVVVAEIGRLSASR